MFKSNRLHIVFGQQISSCTTALHCQLAQVFTYFEFLEMKGGLKCNTNHFRFAVRISSKISNTAAGFTLRHIIFLITSYTSDKEALHIIRSASAITIDNIIDCTCIVFLEYINVQNICSDKYLLSYANNFIFTITMEDNDIIQIGAVAQELIFFETSANKALFTVNIEFFVSLNYRFNIDISEVTHLRLTRIFVSVFSFQILKPTNGIIG